MLAGVAIWLGPALRDLARLGVFDRPVRRAHVGTSEENLRAIYTALMLYHQSEEMLPYAEGWMDAVAPRLRTDDLQPGAERDRLRNPLLDPGPDEYGYAMNSALSGKFLGDIEDPSRTILVFDSRDTRWNAHGDPRALAPDPPRPGGNLAVTVDGTVRPLDELLSSAEP